jgi:hypothetical protein
MSYIQKQAARSRFFLVFALITCTASICKATMVEWSTDDGRTPLAYAPTWNDVHSVSGLNSYVVEYVPEPTTLLLFGLGGIFLRKRRRA